MFDSKGKKVERFSLPVLRPTTGHGSQPPCATCPKVPEGHPNPSPEAAIDLDERGKKAWAFYKRCKAVNRFPEDEAVEVVAAEIREVEERCDRIDEDVRFARIGIMLGMQAALKSLRGR